MTSRSDRFETRRSRGCNELAFDVSATGGRLGELIYAGSRPEQGYDIRRLRAPGDDLLEPVTPGVERTLLLRIVRVPVIDGRDALFGVV